MIFKNPKPQTILSFHYLVHFSIMGAFLPYFNLYCFHLNFSELQIGVMSAARILSMVFFSIIWGAIADFAFSRKKIYIICTLVSALTWSLFIFTTNFWPMLVIMLLYSAFYGPIIAFLETFTLEVLKSSGSANTHYGNIRVWGSISFIIMAIVLGPVIDYFSIKIIIPLILIPSLIQMAYSFKIPEATQLKNSASIKNIINFFTIRTSLFLIATFLMLISHGTYYGFFSIHLEKAGFNSIFIGIAWGLATFSEIAVMLKSHIIFKRFSIKSVLISSLIVASFRWILLSYTISPTVILLSQLLHAITYGTFHIACILYIDKITSKETKTFGQIIYNATSYGLGMMVGFIINGFFFEQYGSTLFIFSSISSLTGGLILLASFRSRA